MSKKKRKFYSRHGVGAILSGLLCFGVTALAVFMLFLPAFGYSDSLGTVNYNVLDYALFGFRDFVPSLVEDKFDGFLRVFQAYDGDNPLYTIIVNYHNYLEMALSGLLIIAVLLAGFIAVLGVFWLLAGRLLMPKLSLTICWATVIFYGLAFGALFGYLYLYNLIASTLPDPVSPSFFTHPLIAVAGLFAMTLVMAIIYAAAFSNRKYKSRRQIREEREEAEEKERLKEEARARQEAQANASISDEN